MSDTLHILTLTPFYPNDRDGAKGCFISEPLDSLAKRGAHSTVFAVEPVYRGRFHNGATGIPAERFGYFSLPSGFGLPVAGAFVFARIVARLRQLHREQRVDVIHAHGPLPCGHAAMLLSTELQIPFVISVHGLDAFSDVQVGGRSGKWCRRISERAYSASRRVICISEHVREQVLEGMGRNCRTSVVYNGVNSDQFSPAGDPEPNAPVILSVGNLIPTKGHELLIRAAAALVPEFNTLRVEIVGHGSELEHLHALARQLKVDDSVTFLGRRSRQEVVAAMRRCTVFALPSRYEGLGCVYLEAMSVGKPIIGCRGQGIAEIVHHGSNGILVGPDNERELTLALGMLLRDAKLRKNLGTAARDTILDKLTLAQQAESLMRIYREAVA